MILDLKKIQELVDELDRLRQQQDLYLKIQQQPEPEAPLKIDSVEEWEIYQNSIKNWYSAGVLAAQNRTDGERAISKHMRLMCQWIPANIWIRLKDCYVGYQTDSWPGYEPKIQKKDLDSKLPKLKHCITNG